MQKLTGQSKNQGRSAAFFDLDGTLIYGDTQAMEAARLFKRNRTSPRYVWAILRTLAAIRLCRAGRISLARQNEIYLTSYRGFTRDELTAQARVLFETVVRKRFLSMSVETLDAHRRQGDLIVLVSATTRHLLDPFDAVLKPDFVFCTDLEFDARGRATGRAVDGICAEEKKAGIVRSFAREKGIDLAASHAYSDHHSDIPFLSCTGHAHAVNPTAGLARHARKMGWDIRYVG